MAMETLTFDRAEGAVFFFPHGDALLLPLFFEKEPPFSLLQQRRLLPVF